MTKITKDQMLADKKSWARSHVEVFVGCDEEGGFFLLVHSTDLLNKDSASYQEQILAKVKKHYAQYDNVEVIQGGPIVAATERRQHVR